MSWWAVGTAVASAVVQQYNQAQTAKKQDRIAARNIKDQAELQRQANARLNDQLTTLETSTPDDEYAQRSSDIRKQLRLKQAMGLAGIQNAGGGEAITSAAEEGRGKAIDYGDFINSAVSAMDAPVLQRQGERFMMADTESNLNKIRRNSAQRDALMRLRMAGVRDNPWLTMLAQGLSAYSGAAAGGAFSGGGTSSGAGGLANLGGQTPQNFYNPNGLRPSGNIGMSPDGFDIFLGKFGP